jgi:hypothetical protein
VSERVAQVPTLDQLAEHPEAAVALPRATVQVMLFRAMAAQQACVAALLVSEPPTLTVSEPDRLLTARDAAPLLGISVITLLRKRHRAPYRDFVVSTGTRRPGFSLHRIQHHIELHAGSAAPTRRSVPGGAASAAPSPARLIGG